MCDTDGGVLEGGSEVGVVVGDILRMDFSFCSFGLTFFLGCGEMDCWIVCCVSRSCGGAVDLS